MRKFGPLLVTAALVLAGAGCTGTSTTTVNTNLPPEQPAPAPAVATGRAVFSVTDAADDMSGVTAVEVTVDKIEAHSATQNWVTVSTTPKTYDLLQLKATNTAQLLADANLAADTYDQVRLSVSKVSVTANGKTQEATLPSGTIKIVGSLTVTAGQTSTAELDFLADRSLHLTGNGRYIFAPVVRLLTTRNAIVKIGADEKVEADSSATETDRVHGMDVQGDMKPDFELKDKLDIDVGGQVKVRSEE